MHCLKHFSGLRERRWDNFLIRKQCSRICWLSKYSSCCDVLFHSVTGIKPASITEYTRVHLYSTVFRASWGIWWVPSVSAKLCYYPIIVLLHFSRGDTTRERPYFHRKVNSCPSLCKFPRYFLSLCVRSSLPGRVCHGGNRTCWDVSRCPGIWWCSPCSRKKKYQQTFGWCYLLREDI